MAVSGKKIVVVMPAYNAAKTLEETYKDIPREIVDEIILVDDASKDETINVAKKLGLKVFIHSENLGYGGNQKTCYREALKTGADIVVMLHPDYQYDPKLIPDIISPIVNDEVDLVLASRMKDGSALRGGMPLYKYACNKFLTFVENIVLNQELSEFHTGYRAYSKALLETIPVGMNSNNFVFDTELIVQTIAFGFKIKEIACPTRYLKDSSSVSFKNSVLYGTSTLITLLKYIMFKTGIKNSLFEANTKNSVSGYPGSWVE